MESITERERFKNLFLNSTSRLLLGVWVLAKGSKFPFKSIAELISVSEDALDPKLQTLAGMGLIHIVTDNRGERAIEFLPAQSPEIEKIVHDLFESRQSDFEAIDLKLRSLIYKTLLEMNI